MLWRLRQRRVVRRHQGAKWARRQALREGTSLTANLARADLHERQLAADKNAVDSPLSDQERARAHTWAQRFS